MKKRSITLHREDGNELVFTNGSFNYAYSENGETIVCIYDEEFQVTESCRVIAELIDNSED